MEKNGQSPNQPMRGKNWTDEETRLLITVLEIYFPNLQGRGRKAKVFERIAHHLKDQHGISRTAKEVQNKCKSMIKDYRSAAALHLKDLETSARYKWFSYLNAFMKSAITSQSEFPSCNKARTRSSPFPSTTEGEENVKQAEQSTNSRMISSTDSYTQVIQDPSLSCTATERHELQTAELLELPQLRLYKELDLQSVPDEELNAVAKKRRVSSEDDEDNGAPSSSACTWKLLKREIKEHTQISSQIQHKICNSLDNFNQMIQSLNGTLSLLPTLFSQLVQCQTNQFSQFPQQNRQTTPVLLSPLPQQPAIPQLEQGCNTQYVWVYDPSAVGNGKAALPGP